MYFSSLGFVLWPPSLLGCGGRLIPKKVEMYTKHTKQSVRVCCLGCLFTFLEAFSSL